MSFFAHTLHDKPDTTIRRWLNHARHELCWLHKVRDRARYAEWMAEIRELLRELHRREVPLSDTLIHNLRFEGIDPTPPLKFCLTGRQRRLVW